MGRNFIDFGTIGGAPQGNVMCPQNAKFDRRACRSVEPQVIAHQFVTSALYDLRFGKDRRYLSTGLLGQIVGGFRVNGILTLRSACRSSVRGANNGGTADRPNVVGDPELSGDERSLTRWFNTSAFTAPPPFTFGTAPRVLSRPRGPGFASVDLVVARTLTFSATSNVQLRAEFFNLFNRVNFNQPNTNFLSGEFGQIVSAGEGRRVQFGAKLYF